LPKIILGIKFTDGIEVVRSQAQTAAAWSLPSPKFGDSSPSTGVFGNHDCMGEVRDWPFDAVIGIGGVGRESQTHRIAGKLTWIGIGPQTIGYIGRGPQLIFRHFWCPGEYGPLLRTNYPALASRMYDTNRRVVMHSPSSSERQDINVAGLDRDVRKILGLAMDAPPSNGPTHQYSKKKSGKCSVLPNRACRIRRSCVPDDPPVRFLL